MGWRFRCSPDPYLSPLGWEHFNLTGDYVWRRNARVGAGKFRPLRPVTEA